MLFDALVIGAGVIGAALARSLSLKKPNWKIGVLEKEEAPAKHTSGRNSGVIHSGFNQKPGTLKARLCVEGNRLMKEYCLKHKVPMAPVGTLVVATTHQEWKILGELLSRGRENGVPNLNIIDTKRLKELEPNAKGLAALHSPAGAIVDSQAFVKTIAQEAQENRVEFHFFNKVTAIEEREDNFDVFIQNKTGSQALKSRILINCAGLYADKMAHLLGAGEKFTIIPFRGEYFKIRQGKAGIVRSMIYPVPNLKYPFLGIHWTKKIDGGLAIGPNAVLALGRESYRPFQINFRETLETFSSCQFRQLLSKSEFWKMAFKQLRLSLSKKAFIREASKLVEGLRPEDLTPGSAGNRAQLVDGQGALVDDLVIERKGASWHILNAVSPGFTSSLAFSDHLTQKILQETC